MTFFERAVLIGIRATAREIAIDDAVTRRCFHGLVRINDRLLDACAQAWSDVDRHASVLEWDRRRQNHLALVRKKNGRQRRAHLVARQSGQKAAADAA